jgi:SRSO17 transposase
MSLLKHPTAQALLADAKVSAAAVAGCRLRLAYFLQRYLPRFYRSEHHELARVVLEGKLSNLHRKTAEPIAYQAGRPRKPVQHFVGAGGWDDEAVMAELRCHVAEALGDPDGVLVLDASAVAKSGSASCGVARQWCGRLGKVENCQIGLFLAYVTAAGQALVDRRLYLPRDWADHAERRQRTYVPPDVPFQESWRIGLALLDRASADLPVGWVAGDDEFGRVSALRAGLRGRRLRYVLDVPSNTLLRDLAEPLAPGRQRPPWRRADVWAQALPRRRWRKVPLGPGSKRPKLVWATEAWVQTKDEDGCVGPRERLVVIRTIDQQPRTWYTLSNAPADVSLAKVVAVHSQRHAAEELFATAKGDVGLSHYEVRSWVGWHHHMTLSLLALWFLELEKDRLGGKNPGLDRAADPRNLLPSVIAESAAKFSHCRAGQPRTAAQRRGAHLPLAREDRRLPTAAWATGWIKRLQSNYRFDRESLVEPGRRDRLGSRRGEFAYSGLSHHRVLGRTARAMLSVCEPSSDLLQDCGPRTGTRL